MSDRIEFMVHEPYDFRIQHEEIFSLNKNRKAVWLQKACIWILRKLGCQWVEVTTKFRRVTVDPQSFMKELFRQREEIIGRLRGEPAVLLMGFEDYEELMRTEVGGMRSFAFQGEYHTNRKMAGLDVRVIPYMKGMLVIDKRDMKWMY